MYSGDVVRAQHAAAGVWHLWWFVACVCVLCIYKHVCIVLNIPDNAFHDVVDDTRQSSLSVAPCTDNAMPDGPWPRMCGHAVASTSALHDDNVSHMSLLLNTGCHTATLTVVALWTR